jgi:hypothetical protein
MCKLSSLALDHERPFPENPRDSKTRLPLEQICRPLIEDKYMLTLLSTGLLLTSPPAKVTPPLLSAVWGSVVRLHRRVGAAVNALISIATRTVRLHWLWLTLSVSSKGLSYMLSVDSLSPQASAMWPNLPSTQPSSAAQ